MGTAETLPLDPEQRAQLERLEVEAAADWLRRRAQILLLYHEGYLTRQVADAVGRSRGRVCYWRRQFRLRGMAVFPPPKTAPPLILTHEGNPMTSDLPPDTVAPLENPESVLQTGDATQAGDPPLDRPDLPEPPHSPEILATNELLAAFEGLNSPGLLPDDPLAEAGRKTLRFHFAEMLRHEAGTRLGEDIEELHDMRVATRRMRAAFEIFAQGFKPKALARHLKGLRQAGRTLGRARDLDVFVEKAERYQAGLPQGQQQGLAPLLAAWEEQRVAARQSLANYLDGPDYQAFKKDFFHFVTKAGAGAQKPGGGGLAPSLVREIAPVLIYTRLAAVRAYADLLPSASLEQFHALRIEFKKLRYTLEFFREVLGEESKPVINDLKGLQDHLGDLNDAQVATQILSDFLLHWDAQQAALPVGQRQNPEPVVAYLAYQHAERFHLMTTFYNEAWACFDRPEFRRNLALAVSVL